MPGTAFGREAIRLREEAGLSTGEIARATGAAKSTVRGWIGFRSEPTGDRAVRIAELVALIERLEEVVDHDYIRIWLNKPIKALDEQKPLDLIREGEYQRVAKAVAAIRGPGVS